MKYPKFSNLYGQIFAIFWFTMLVVLVTVIIVQDADPRQIHPIQKHNIAKLENLAQHLQRKYQNYTDINAVLEHYYGSKRYRNDQEGKPKRPKTMLFFTDINGNLTGSYYRIPRRAVQNFISGLDTLDTPKQKLYGRHIVAGPVPVHIAGQDVLLFVNSDWQQTPPFLLQLFESPVKLLLAVMLVSTPLLLWLAYALSRPARRLENAARRVANGKFIEDPELEKGSSEFRAAGAAFNQMVLAINQMISGHQRLLSDISHELRSPLTRLRMANALATRKQGESAELTRIDTEAERLEKMIGELLELSRMQMNSHQIIESHSAATLWQELIKDAQFEAAQNEKNLHSSTIPQCIVTGNPALLMSAVENIIRNAIYYSHSTIEVEFTVLGQQLHICVEDDGNGVPDEELNDIFRPFYRVSTARDRHSGGAGLGLAITESAVRQHNGEISASKSEPGGLKITISLPIEGR